jgi:hypothetical protein
MSQHQTTGKRIIRWILLNYFAVLQNIRNIAHAYTTAENPLEYMASPTHSPFFAQQGNILNAHTTSIAQNRIMSKEQRTKNKKTVAREEQKAKPLENPEAGQRQTLKSPER